MQKHLDLNKYRVFVFGSRVTGKSSERSDIDIGIDGATAVSAVIMESIKFEFCFDLSWKLVKTFLEEVKGVQCQSPKDCWRQAYTTGIITYDDFWMKLTDARNQTRHTYNETTAEEVHALLPDALKHFQELLKTLN